MTEEERRRQEYAAAQKALADALRQTNYRSPSELLSNIGAGFTNLSMGMLAPATGRYTDNFPDIRLVGGAPSYMKDEEGNIRTPARDAAREKAARPRGGASGSWDAPAAAPSVFDLPDSAPVVIGQPVAARPSAPSASVPAAGDPSASSPVATGSTLPRARASAGGTLTSNAQSDSGMNGRTMLEQALKMYSSGPDLTALNEYAAQRAKEGDSSMLNALAAQFAGEDFAPVQAQYLRRSLAAQEPMKIGDYGVLANGKFVADPYAARDTQANALYRAGGQIMADDRADRREAAMFDRQAAQLASAERRANAREDRLLDREDKKTAEAKRKEDLRTQSRIATADTVLNNVNDARALLDKTWGGGITRSRTSQVPGTDAYTLAKRIDTIKANIGFDALSAMREASPTGGALGQVAVQEINYLQSTIANLDIGLPDEELAKSLDAVDRHYNNIKMVQQGILPPEYRNGTAQPAASDNEQVVVDW